MSVRRRKYDSGRTVWVAYVRVNGHRKRGNFKTFREAKHAEARWREDLESRSYRLGKIPTVGAWVETVICEHIRGRELKDAEKTCRILRRFASEFGNDRLDKITPDDIHAYLHRIKARSYNGHPQLGSTNNRYRSWICRAFSLAVRRGILSNNPVLAVERYKEHARTRWLEPDEVHALIDAAHPLLKPLVVCAVNTGARRGELLNLDWSDVDFRRQEVVIRAGSTKSGKGRRVPMTPEVETCLKDLYETGPQEGAVFRRGDGERWSVFPRHHWKQAISKSGIANSKEERLQGLRFHDLRHTAATKMVEAGVDISVVSAILGHSSVGITSHYYAHVTRKAQHEAVERLGHALNGQ